MSTPLGAQPPISITRDARIDGVANNLVTATWLLPTRGGGVVFSQREDVALVAFDSMGKLIGRFGRSGQGPGEFMAVGSAGFVGDSIWVYDLLERRITVITPALKFVRSFDVAGVRPPAAQARTLPTTTSSTAEALYGDGTRLVHAVALPPAVPAGFDSTGRPLFRVSSDGTIRKYVAHVPEGPPSSVTMSSGRGSRSLVIPYSSRLASVVSARGSKIAMLHTVYEGRLANTMRLVVLTENGDTVYAKNIPFNAERIPQRLADSAKANMIERARVRPGAAAGVVNPDDAILADLVRTTVKIPPVYAPFSKMIVSEEGSVWILLRRRAGRLDHSWLVVDTRGNVAGLVNVAAGTNFMALTASHVWGTERDADDIMSIVSYRIGGAPQAR